ncbi:MAG: hypothetical protein WCF85_02975 [Rhodospirillaceae bacterium]
MASDNRANHDFALEQRKRKHERESAHDDGPSTDEINQRYQRAVWYE